MPTGSRRWHPGQTRTLRRIRERRPSNGSASPLIVLDGDPPLARTSEQWREQPNGFGVLVQLPDPVRVLTALPLPERDDVPRSVLIDEQLVRDVALEGAHV